MIKKYGIFIILFLTLWIFYMEITKIYSKEQFEKESNEHKLNMIIFNLKEQNRQLQELRNE